MKTPLAYAKLDRRNSHEKSSDTFPVNVKEIRL